MMRDIVARCAIGGALAASGCGIQGPVVLPMTFDASATSARIVYPDWTTSRNPDVVSAVIREFDDWTNQTRVRVTTHAGDYETGPAEPRVSFLFAYDGYYLRGTPKWVYMVFQIREPAFPGSPQLAIRCESWSIEDVAPSAYQTDPGTVYDARYYVYQFSVQDFVDMASCNEAEVAVGRLGVSLQGDQIFALRELAHWLTPPRRGGSG